MLIVVACYGSSCRSPMAKALLDREIGEQASVVARALTCPARSVADEAVQVMQEIGLEIGRHTPTLIADSEIKEADLVLVMERSHLEETRRRWPDETGKIHLIRQYALGEDAEIPDPIARTDRLQAYRQTRTRLLRAARGVAKRIEGA